MRSAPFYNFLLEAALCGSLMILILLAVRRFLRGRLGSRVIYFAWLLIALRLLTPLSLPNPVMNELRPTLSTNVAVRPIADQIRVRFTDTAMNIAGMMRYERYQPNPARAFFVEIASLTDRGKLGKWLLYGYGGVAVSILAYMALKNRAFRRRLKRDRVEMLSGGAQKTYEDICKAYRVKAVPVYFTDPLESACLVGAFRPFIALPLTLKQEDLPQVLAHEVCHLKTRDGLFGLLRNLCLAVHWFNPLVWLGAQLSRVDCEMACDNRVTSRMEEDQRIAYANALVMSAARRQAPALTVVSTCMTMKGRHLKGRIAAIVKDRRVTLTLAAAFALLFALGMAFSFATAEWGTPNSRAAHATFAGVTFPPQAQRRALASLKEARAYAEAFFSGEELDIPYSDMTVDLEQTEAGFTATARFAQGEPNAVLRFDGEGVITSFDHTGVIGVTQESPVPYTADTVDPSFIGYIDRFVSGHLPGIGFEAIAVQSDVEDAAGRYLTLVTSTGKALKAHRIVAQVSPGYRILAFELLADRAQAVYDTPPTLLPKPVESLQSYVEGLLLQKGPWFAWSLEDKAELSSRMPLLIAKYRDNQGVRNSIGAIWDHAHGLPGQGDISYDDALAIAKSALVEAFGLKASELSALSASPSFYVDDPDSPVWDVHFAKGGDLKYSVQVAARSKTVLQVDDGHQGVAAQPTPAPAVTGQPGTGGITEEEAIALARQALIDYLGLDKALADRLLVTDSGYMNYSEGWAMQGITQPFWWVGFVREEHKETYGMEFSVLLDAQTGRVLVINDPNTISNG